MKKILHSIFRAKPIYNHRREWFLILIAFLFVLFRLPSLVEPHWYGDEGIYQVVGRAIDDGRILYRDIWDNKPPILYLIYAIFKGDLFPVKLASLICGLLSVFTFFLLSGKVFKSNTARYISTTVYAIFFATPLLEGNIANAENFMLLPITLAAFFVLSFFERKKTWHLVLAGLLLSIAFMTKIVTIFDFAAFNFFLIILNLDSIWNKRKKVLTQNFLPYLYFCLTFLSLFVVYSFYYLSIGDFNDFFNSVFFQNISYVGFQNALIFPMGALILKTVLLVVALGIIFTKRKIFTARTLFLYIWLIFSVYSAFFSQRPYTHYLLVLLPVFSLLVGHLFRFKKTMVLDAIFLTGIIIVAWFYFKIYDKPVSYYQNFWSFMTGKINVIDYERFFDENTPLNYEIASFIDSNVRPSEPVFLWSDSAQIYALSNRLPIGKYTVAYHITFSENADKIIKSEIEKVQPRYIIQTTQQPLINELLSSYKLRYEMKGAKIYEREI